MTLKKLVVLKELDKELISGVIAVKMQVITAQFQELCCLTKNTGRCPNRTLPPRKDPQTSSTAAASTLHPQTSSQVHQGVLDLCGEGYF